MLSTTPHPRDENPEFVTVSEDGLKEKFWDPAWGPGAAPDGVSRLEHGDGHDEVETPIYDDLADD